MKFANKYSKFNYVHRERRKLYRKEWRAKNRDKTKAYMKVWREKNKKDQKKKQKQTKITKQLWLRNYKATLKCSRCPENHPATLDFHHVKGKDFSISSMMVIVSIEKIQKEIAKCIVLCSNCHRKEHYNK